MTYTPADTIRRLKIGRIDCTDYLIHFTRNANGRSAYQVLEQIIYDGYIKSGWSYRGEKRTVFGPEPAVCFTEMPLWALNVYASNRKNRDKIDCYGIALSKQELFRSGTRNVIYGTSTPSEIEVKALKSDEMYNPALPINEQYRYMLTGINDLNDWTHEREWRWTKRDATEGLRIDGVEGLPLYIQHPKGFLHHAFSKIIFIVQTSTEKDKLLDIVNFTREIIRKKESEPNSKEIILSDFFLNKTRVLVIDDFKAKPDPYFSIERVEEEMFYKPAPLSHS
ncbi:hypothetical protein ACSX1A_16450 [Pontibacter sp. MBLB2868]|uniref:hypothetical protein n=1 Tax=Pontibacter sp. MBLB2868 TaxID=3451555 RepID=UPI003F74B57C